ncbi:MAG: alpha-galactosidase [Dermabacter sp.]|nr:alpha-galactosidase [Dermabacter sp.]
MPVTADTPALHRSVRGARGLHLSRAGVSLVLDLTMGRMPAVAYWGRALGTLTTAEVDLLCEAAVVAPNQNALDVPPRLGLLPQSADGWLGEPGIVGARTGGAGFAPRLGLTRADLTTDTEDAASGGPADHLALHLEDPDLRLGALLELDLLETGLVRLQGSLTNLAGAPFHLRSFTLALPVPAEAAEILDFAGRWTREREPQRLPVAVGQHLRENRRGRTGADSAYLMHVGTPGFTWDEGQVWALHTAFSGGHRHAVERTSAGETILAGGEGLWPGEVTLDEGETYSSPALYAAYGDGLDAIAERFHRHLRARPHHPSTRRPVTLNVWEAVYFDHDLDGLKDLADRAAALGVERYVLDDGWFGDRRDDYAGLGDWVVSEAAWPNGLGPLIEHVRGLGMEFGLWFEPEMVNEDSDVARAHPEWIAGPSPDRLPRESRHQQVLNLAIEEAYAHVRDQMVAVLEAHPIDYIKWDCNRDFIESGIRATGAPTVREQSLAAYRLADELRARFPGLEIEACASGGARVDLGVLERADRVWVSDCIDPHERQVMNRWTNQLIPLELMGSHVASGASHTTGRLHSLGYRAATALFGHLGIEWDLREATPGELEELAGWVALYKQVRELLFTGTRVRVSLGDPSLWGHGVVAADGSEALYSLTAMERSGAAQTGRMRFPGLLPEARYRLDIVNPGADPFGLVPSPVMAAARGEIAPTPANARERAAHGAAVSTGEESSPVLTGRAWELAGFTTPILSPDTSVLFHFTRVTGD